MASIGTRIYSFFAGKHVGTDEFGNRYYVARKDRKQFKIGRGGQRRWVLYKGIVEPSKVPPHWHGWLHHMSDEVPTDDVLAKRHVWQKQHTPNLTGTALAYKPPGHFSQGGQRGKVSSDYEAWSPDQAESK